MSSARRLAVLAATALAVACAPPAPPPPPPSVGLVVVGDAGSGTPDQWAVADAMARLADSTQLDALVTTGDNVYPDGDPARFGALLDAPYARLRARMPMWATLGNHDVVAGNGPAQLPHLGLPAANYERTVTHGDVSVQLLVLDSNGDLAAQAAWLDARLAASTATWHIVAFHHPAWSCSTHGSTAAVVATLVPVLRSHRVDLVLQGHDHAYQRFADGPTAYVVTGGGGAALYPVGACAPTTPPLLAAASEFHFLDLRATSSTLSVRARTPDGRVLDEFTLAATP